VHFPPPFIYLRSAAVGVGGRAFRRTLRSFDIDWRLLVVNAALNPCRSERALTYSRQCDRPLQWTGRSARLWHPSVMTIDDMKFPNAVRPTFFLWREFRECLRPGKPKRLPDAAIQCLGWNKPFQAAQKRSLFSNRPAHFVRACDCGHDFDSNSLRTACCLNGGKNSLVGFG
jgi:hypothetical protein